jgi:hypothetical protein
VNSFSTLVLVLRGLWITEGEYRFRRNTAQAFLGVAPSNEIKIVSNEDLAHVQYLLGLLANEIGFMEWQSAKDRIALIVKKLKPGISVDEMHIEMEGLQETINIELQKRWYLYIPAEKAPLYQNYGKRWAHIILAFVETEPEVSAAIRCYVCGNNTASVFHSMRIAEYGLRALAKERRIRLPKRKPVEWATWQDIIGKLSDEVQSIAKNKSPGPAKDRALEFYSGAIADLNGFKDEYRNLVMHVRAQYNEQQALRASERVGTFMDRLVAQKMNNRHYRIRWGFR